MAGWIKMNVSLRTNPHVVRISSALKADRLRVIGALWAVWCVFDAHSADGRLDGYDFTAMDEEIGWAGFSSAMGAVGWLVETSDGALTAPDFDQHNGASAKRRAQESDRKKSARDADKDRTESGQTSASNADKKRTREEKRREEKNTPLKPPKGVVEVPDWIPAEPWADFVTMRRAKGQKTPFTVGAAKGIVAKLAAFRDTGHDVARILEQSTINGWADVFEVRAKGGANLTALAGAV